MDDHKIESQRLQQAERSIQFHYKTRNLWWSLSKRGETIRLQRSNYASIWIIRNNEKRAFNIEEKNRSTPMDKGAQSHPYLRFQKQLEIFNQCYSNNVDPYSDQKLNYCNSLLRFDFRRILQWSRPTSLLNLNNLEIIGLCLNHCWSIVKFFPSSRSLSACSWVIEASHVYLSRRRIKVNSKMLDRSISENRAVVADLVDQNWVLYCCLHNQHAQNSKCMLLCWLLDNPDLCDSFAHFIISPADRTHYVYWASIPEGLFWAWCKSIEFILGPALIIKVNHQSDDVFAVVASVIALTVVDVSLVVVGLTKGEEEKSW